MPGLREIRELKLWTVSGRAWLPDTGPVEHVVTVVSLDGADDATRLGHAAIASQVPGEPGKIEVDEVVKAENSAWMWDRSEAF